MKNSIKISVVLLALSSLLSQRLSAQSTSTSEPYGSGIRLSVGADAGLPVGSLKHNYDWSLGGSVQGDFPIVKDALYATLNGGYQNFFAKNSSNANDLHLIPVKAGLKYFPISYFYLQGEAGVSFITNKHEIDADKSSAFVYAPQVGVLLNVGGKNYVDAGVRFEGNTKFYDGGKSNNFFALRVAYSFGL
jgi:hypothetical protein